VSGWSAGLRRHGLRNNPVNLAMLEAVPRASSILTRNELTLRTGIPHGRACREGQKILYLSREFIFLLFFFFS
jgi:hypothetical protein